MEDLDEVRRRIAQKHHPKQEKVLGEREFSWIYRLAVSTLCLCIIGLGAGSYLKQNPQLKSQVNKESVQNWFSQHVLSVIPFFEIKSDTQVVSSPLAYEHLENNLYRGSDQQVLAIAGGIVTQAKDGKVSVKQDNGIMTTYDTLTKLDVAIYDHVSKGEVIGQYEDSFKMNCYLDEQEITYEQALSQN